MNMLALSRAGPRFMEHANLLIDRAADIARGGNGRVGARQDETAS
jgi:hypothetical protein